MANVTNTKQVTQEFNRKQTHIALKKIFSQNIAKMGFPQPLFLYKLYILNWPRSWVVCASFTTQMFHIWGNPGGQGTVFDFLKQKMFPSLPTGKGFLHFLLKTSKFFISTHFQYHFLNRFWYYVDKSRTTLKCHWNQNQFLGHFHIFALLETVSQTLLFHSLEYPTYHESSSNFLKHRHIVGKHTYFE